MNVSVRANLDHRDPLDHRDHPLDHRDQKSQLDISSLIIAAVLEVCVKMKGTAVVVILLHLLPAAIVNQTVRNQ